MASDLEKNLMGLRRVLLGGPVSRFIDFLAHKRLESFALNQRIPYGAKRSLADSVSDYETAKLKRIKSVDPGVAAFYVLLKSESVPVHMHHQEWNGVPYMVYEEKNRLSGGSDFTVFFSDLKFPNFSQDTILSPELEVEGDSYNTYRSQLDSHFEFDVWKKVLYQSPVFRGRSSLHRPGLSDTISFESVPYKGVPKNVRVPFFRTESLMHANAEARAIIEVYQKYQEPIEGIVELLKADPEVRREFIDIVSPLEAEQLLKRHGLDIDTLPKVVSKTEETHEGVPYTIYEARGGSFGGSNEIWYWGFINGIQFPDFRAESRYLEYEGEISHETLKLTFDYALYTDPFFNPKREHRGTPSLVSGSRYDKEAQIAEIEIPDRTVIPFTRHPNVDFVRKKIELSIDTYNAYRNQIARIVEKLSNGEIQEGLNYILKELHVYNLSDSVAEFLGEQGASFIVESPYHLERQREMQEWRETSMPSDKP